MTLDRSRELLRQAMAELTAARRHPDYSYARAAGLPENLQEVEGSELETAEAFTSRFSRAVDLLVNKVLRGLDRLKLRPEGTLLDVVNAAEKRGFVSTADQLRELKGVRNAIAHDYAGAQLPQIFAYCRAQKPAFDEVCMRVETYISRLGG